MSKTWCAPLLLVLAGAAPAGTDDARALLDRAVQAAGGETRLAQYKAATWTAKGVAHGSAAVFFTDRCAAEWPGRYRIDSSIGVKGQSYQRSLVLNGEQGWIKQGGQAEEMRPEVLAEMRDKVRALHLAATLLPLKDRSFRLACTGDTKVGDRPALGLKAVHPDHPDLHLYFDKDKGLLLMCWRHVKDPLRGDKVIEETFFDDYHEVGGLRVARKITVKRDGKPFLDAEISDFRPRERLDRDTFERP